MAEVEDAANITENKGEVMKTYTLMELSKHHEEYVAEKRRSLRWGNWQYDPKRICLTYLPFNYDVDLEECWTSADILDWIFQIFRKEWNEVDIIDFLQAIQDLLDPQAYYCSGGANRTHNPKLAIQKFFGKL